MKRGRYIEPAILSGRIRVEVTADVTKGSLADGSREPLVTIVEVKADSQMSEDHWRQFVAEVEKAIEGEKRDAGA